MNSINNATMTVNNQETVINSSTVINMEEVTKKLQKEEKVLQCLTKSKADASVITIIYKLFIKKCLWFTTRLRI